MKKNHQTGISILDVKRFWNNESCGERYSRSDFQDVSYTDETAKRYQLEPYILDFAKFDEFCGLDVLEIGVGMGSDHSSIALNGPKSLTGIDLTERAITHTKKRFKQQGLSSSLLVDNAEKLSFSDNQFDKVYSWGVLHHSEHPEKCFDEVWRVLKKSGEAKIMIYNKYSLTGFFLWIKYAFLKGKFFTPMAEIYSQYLESPGTKAYTPNEAKLLFQKFEKVKVEVQLGFGDLLLGKAGARHGGILLNLGRIFYPRFFVRLISKIAPIGLYLLITVRK